MTELSRPDVPQMPPGALAPLGRRSTRTNDFKRPQRRDRPKHHEALRPGARQQTLRESNLLLLTEEIFSASEPLSRADLSVRTGMTRSTVARLVEDLMAAGIVREGAPIDDGTRGRPAVPLHPASRTLAGLGVEVSVDFMVARVLDLTGAVLAEEFIEGDFRDSDPQNVIPQTGELARRVAQTATESGATVVGTVIAIPGLVDARDERLLLAPNLGWRDVNVVAMLCGNRHGDDETPLEPLFGSFISMANEAKLAALAVAQELTAAEEKEQTFLYVSTQIGIGAAVVVDGLVDEGPRGWAGEIGHTAVQPDGPRCGCGASGCLEVFAGKRALVTAAGLDAGASAHELLALTEQGGDPSEQALEAIDTAGWALGVAVSGAVNLLDVEDVVLGGAFGPLADLLRPRIEQELNRRVLASAWSSFRVRQSSTGVAPAATGAALRALRAVVDAPLNWIPDEPLEA